MSTITAVRSVLSEFREPWERETIEESEIRRVAESLLQIQDSPLHKMALEVATNEVTVSAARIGEQLSRYDNKNKDIFLAVGFYLVFQVVLITVVAQSSILREDNLWSPLALSSVAFGICFIFVWQNGLAIANLRGDMHDENNIHKMAEKTRSELRRLGRDYAFPASTQPKSKKRSTLVYFRSYALILLFLVCFTLLILFSQWRILSDVR